MKEIEVKAKVQDAKALREKLKGFGWLPSKATIQDDRVFIKNGIDYAAIPPGTIFLRLRDQEGLKTFTLKQRLKTENELQCLEYETTIENPDAIADMLSPMDFYEVVRVKKAREEGELNGMGICLDEVEGLGSFVEVEKMIEDETQADRIQAELFQFLESLGVSKDDQVTKGYDTLMYWKNKEK